MRISILSNKKKQGNRIVFTKRREQKVNCFLYDEDYFWFDYGGKRFGLDITNIVAQRKQLIKELREENKKFQKGRKEVKE